MTDTYEGNGDYSYTDGSSSDFKRKNQNLLAKEDGETENDDQDGNPTSEKVYEYIRDLMGEKSEIDHKYPHAERLLEQEITKCQQTGKIPTREPKYVDIYREKQIKVTVKVLVPVKEHPKFNFVGKLLGPKGNSMKRLQEDTMCKMAVLGRGSVKDRKKEEELRASQDPKYAHLNDELHVEISALAPPAEAHARIAYALAEVRKYLIPDSNDIIRQEQMREMLADGTIPEDGIIEKQIPIVYKKPSGGHHAASSSSSSSTRPPYAASYHHHHHHHRIPSVQSISRSASGSGVGGGGGAGGGGGSSTASGGGSSRTVMPAKQKILSILDRARSAMDETNHYDEMSPVASAYDSVPYDSYAAYGHVASVSSRQRYSEIPDYEPVEYRRSDYYRESSSYSAKGSSSSANVHHSSSWKSSSDGHSHGQSGGGGGSSGGGGHSSLYGASSAETSGSGSHGHHHSSSKHSHSSHSRESRYRSSPYTRPSK